MELLAQNSDKIIALLLLFTISVSLRIILQFIGQQWITTIAHTGTLVILPIITYVITNVISGNIALSLGMIGALSIVRFRNPVRSPLELSIYFGAITMGISASVSIIWLLFLFGSFLFVIFGLIIFNILSLKIFKQKFFNISFTEGNSLCTLSITTSEKIKNLDNNLLLNSKVKINNKFNYTFVSNNFSELQKILSEVEKDKSLIDFQLNKN